MGHIRIKFLTGDAFYANVEPEPKLIPKILKFNKLSPRYGKKKIKLVPKKLEKQDMIIIEKRHGA